MGAALRGTAVIALFVLVTGGCAEPPPSDNPQVERTLADQLDTIEALTNEEQSPGQLSARYLEYFSADASMLPLGGRLVEGREAIFEFYSRVFGMGTLVSNRYSDPVIDVFEGKAVRTCEGDGRVSARR